MTQILGPSGGCEFQVMGFVLLSVWARVRWVTPWGGGGAAGAAPAGGPGLEQPGMAELVQVVVVDATVRRVVLDGPGVAARPRRQQCLHSTSC